MPTKCGALCGGDPGDALTRAFLGLPLDGSPPHDEAGWLGPNPRRPRRAGHYYPEGTAQSACGQWERPGGWVYAPAPAPAPAPPERACVRCEARWRRDLRRAGQGRDDG